MHKPMNIYRPTKVHIQFNNFVLQFRPGEGAFGLEKEKPNDLLNIFFRSVRYCIYRNRKYATGPSIEALEELLVDELDRKYGKEKWKKYEEHPSEFMAISWLRMKKGWNHIKPTWLPQI